MPSDELDVVIVGAGFSGLCVALRLARRCGVRFTVLEQAHGLGGTWRDNTYPGCACDIPSPLYSYSFAQSGLWSRLFAPQREILDYLEGVARQRGLLDRIRFGARVVRADWDDDAERWRVTLAGGERVHTRALVLAIGALHVPQVPPLPGLASFTGERFHSATWNHDHDLSGRRVAVVGTGASAIQFVPAIAEPARHITVFQRTAPWIVPKADRAFTARQQQALRRLPPYRWLLRARLFWIHEARAKGFVDDPAEMADTERLARRHLERQVSDPELRARLTPDYAIGCKRLLISSDYYPTLTRPDTQLVTAPISEVRPNSIVCTDGSEHQADTIIFGTGFDAQNALARIPITGRDRRTLAEAWSGGMEAHFGTVVAGFPNLFMMTGPNSGLGHNSQVFMIEAQTRYVLWCLRRLRRHRTIEVRDGAQRVYNAELQRRMRATVWQAGGCRSWYQDPATGRNTLLWPGSTVEFWRRTRLVRRAAHVVTR